MAFGFGRLDTEQAVMVYEQPSKAGGWSVAITLGFQGDNVVIAEIKVFPTPTSWKGEDSIPLENFLPHRAPATHEEAALLSAFHYVKPHMRAPGTWPADGSAIEAAPSGGLTSTLLRRLDIGEAIRDAREVAESTVEFWELREPGSTGPWAERLRTAPRRPGKAGRDDYFYAQVAEWFVTLIQQRAKGPVRRIAKERIVSEHTVRDWLAEARKRGLLTKAAPGRTEGQLTDKAKALLASEEGRNGQRPQEG